MAVLGFLSLEKADGRHVPSVYRIPEVHQLILVICPISNDQFWPPNWAEDDADWNVAGNTQKARGEGYSPSATRHSDSLSD
jgi:hypothetical protein